jgi:hypothetical protein
VTPKSPVNVGLGSLSNDPDKFNGVYYTQVMSVDGYKGMYVAVLLLIDSVIELSLLLLYCFVCSTSPTELAQLMRSSNTTLAIVLQNCTVALIIYSYANIIHHCTCPHYCFMCRNGWFKSDRHGLCDKLVNEGERYFDPREELSKVECADNLSDFKFYYKTYSDNFLKGNDSLFLSKFCQAYQVQLCIAPTSNLFQFLRYERVITQ